MSTENAPDTDGDRSGSATGDLLTPSLPSTPSRRMILSVALGLFLFGGLFLLVGGAALWVLSAYGPEVALTVVGGGMVAVAFLLANVAARAGWI